MQSLVQSLVLMLAFLDEQWQRMAEWQVDVGGVGACAKLENGAGRGVCSKAGKQWPRTMAGEGGKWMWAAGTSEWRNGKWMDVAADEVRGEALSVGVALARALM